MSLTKSQASRILELEAEVRKLKEANQKLCSNLNERMPAHDRDELKCECKQPELVKNNSSDHGNTHICYACLGWSKK